MTNSPAGKSARVIPTELVIGSPGTGRSGRGAVELLGAWAFASGGDTVGFGVDAGSSFAATGSGWRADAGPAAGSGCDAGRAVARGDAGPGLGKSHRAAAAAQAAASPARTNSPRRCGRGTTVAGAGIVVIGRIGAGAPEKTSVEPNGVGARVAAV